MVCTIGEINTIEKRVRRHLERGGSVLNEWQRDRNLALCDFLPQRNVKPEERVFYAHGVAPTGTGKTVQGVDFIVGANTTSGDVGTFVLGQTEGRNAIIHVPTNLLLDRWEDELLGEPDGRGGRKSGNFPNIRPEHVGVFRASDTFEQKLEALQKPIVLITYDSARILANRKPPVIECTGSMRREVKQVLEEFSDLPRAQQVEIERMLAKDTIEGQALHHLFDIIYDGQQNGQLTNAVINILSDLLGTNLVREDQRLQLRHHFMQTLTNPDHPNRASIAILDEVDDRPRGDATRAYLEEHVLPNCLTFGMTATHLFRNGRTIGDYLFKSQQPVFETTFQAAVDHKEIAPMRNLAFEVSIADAQSQAEIVAIMNRAVERARRNGANDADLDYTDNEMTKMARLAGIDDLAVGILIRGFDPDNRKDYLNMKSVWYCANVGHATTVADKINAGLEKHDQDIQAYLADPAAFLARQTEEDARFWRSKNRGEWQARHAQLEKAYVVEEGVRKFRYAEAVSGRMENQDFNAVITRFRNRDTMALTNNIIMTRGFDDREAELCFQLCPSRSPGRIIQQDGRVMRNNPKDKHKIANVISFLFPGNLHTPEEALVFGQLAGGMRMIPDDYVYPPTEGPTPPPREPRWWLDMSGVKGVITSDEEYRVFRAARSTSDKKPNDRFTSEEMARLLHPRAVGDRFEKEVKRLREQLFDPLAAAFDICHARQQFVGLDAAAAADPSISVASRGQEFPVWRMGYYRVGDHSEFCIDPGIAHLCRYAMFGALKTRPPEFMTEPAAKNAVTGSGRDNPAFNDIMEKVKTAYLKRRAGQQVINVDGAQFDTKTIGFFRHPTDKEAVDFGLTVDALPPLCQLYRKIEAQEARDWAKAEFPNHKTREWLNREDVQNRLEIDPNTAQSIALEQRWEEMRRLANRVGPIGGWAEKDVSLKPAGGGRNETLHCANRQLANDLASLRPIPEDRFCLHADSLPALKRVLGRSHTEAGEVEEGRPARRSGRIGGR